MKYNIFILLIIIILLISVVLFIVFVSIGHGHNNYSGGKTRWGGEGDAIKWKKFALEKLYSDDQDYVFGSDLDFDKFSYESLMREVLDSSKLDKYKDEYIQHINPNIQSNIDAINNKINNIREQTNYPKLIEDRFKEETENGEDTELYKSLNTKIDAIYSQIVNLEEEKKQLLSTLQKIKDEVNLDKIVLHPKIELTSISKNITKSALPVENAVLVNEALPFEKALPVEKTLPVEKVPVVLPNTSLLNSVPKNTPHTLTLRNELTYNYDPDNYGIGDNYLDNHNDILQNRKTRNLDDLKIAQSANTFLIENDKQIKKLKEELEESNTINESLMESYNDLQDIKDLLGKDLKTLKINIDEYATPVQLYTTLKNTKEPKQLEADIKELEQLKEENKKLKQLLLENENLKQLLSKNENLRPLVTENKELAAIIQQLKTENKELSTIIEELKEEYGEFLNKKNKEIKSLKLKLNRVINSTNDDDGGGSNLTIAQSNYDQLKSFSRLIMIPNQNMIPKNSNDLYLVPIHQDLIPDVNKRNNGKFEYTQITNASNLISGTYYNSRFNNSIIL